jgi:hypothetical protein
VTGRQGDYGLHSESEAQQGRKDLPENHAIILRFVIVHRVSRMKFIVKIETQAFRLTNKISVE